MRDRGIPALGYIDDRFMVVGKDTETAESSGGKQGLVTHDNLSKVVWVLNLLTKLGYTLSLPKCQLLPHVTVRFLGMIVETILKAFVLPQD